MIFITGDLHGENDIWKLSGKNPAAKQLKGLTKDDCLIICGDFGLVWDDSPTDRYWRRWLAGKPYTTLFIDGNHENFDLLEQYPVTEWHGGLVQEICPGILHLMRGQMFTLDGLRFFTMGGAESHDRMHRREGVSWWPQEMPSQADFDTARAVLDANDWTADFVLTHSLPSAVQSAMFKSYQPNPLTDFLNELYARMRFRTWFSGHYHLDEPVPFAPQLRLIYTDIVPLSG